MTAAYESLMENKVFGYAAVPKDRKPVESKWIFRWKVKGKREVARAKATLVAKSSSQVPDLDLSETFSPTPQFPSVRLVLAVTVQQDLGLFHLFKIQV